MRLIFYVGKGGVGKTTLAAATAVRAAGLGHRTLVVSTNIAHSLGDVLAVDLGDEPKRVGERLFGQEINVLEEARRQWGTIQRRLAKAIQKEGLPDLQADELAIIPGIEEVAALARIYQQISSTDFDAIVVDAAPTGETLRLLSMPESLEWYTRKLLGWRARLSRLVGPLLRNLLPNVDMLDVVEDLAGRVRQLRALLTDADSASYRIVVTPDRTVLREAQRVETYLNLFGYPIDAVFVNRVLPEMEGPPFLQEMLRHQADLLSEIELSFATLPRFYCPLYPTEPVGLEALAAGAAEVFKNTDPCQLLHRGAAISLTSREGGYVLRIPMPNVDQSRLSINRRGDGIFVEVGNFRRQIPVPVPVALMRPVRAGLKDGWLEIPFEDQPKGWQSPVVSGAPRVTAGGLKIRPLLLRPTLAPDVNPAPEQAAAPLPDL